MMSFYFFGIIYFLEVPYMGAVVAMRFNPIIKAFYDRLVERGKSKKLALTACVHKMLIILNAMVRDNKAWSVSS